MSQQSTECCPDCEKNEKRAIEATAAAEAIQAELRVRLEQRMAEGIDITPMLEALEREGVPIGEVLFP